MGMFVEFRFFKHEGEWERRLWVDLVPKGRKQRSLELRLK